MQPDALVLQADRLVRHGEQRAALRLAQQQVEALAGDFRGTRHIGQVLVYLGQAQDAFAGRTAPLQQGQQVEGDVRVAAQAEVPRAPRVAGHQLGDQVDPLASRSRATWL
ncbi:hypothetical protein I0E98_06030 [Pseudomonas lalucatii]|nr:hypothetical protein [Pseudomonas lalucatii]